MELCALASGSSGNCFYVSNGNSGILIDAGISTKQIIERMSLINKSPETIKAIFITHEHSDHIRGADVFARKFNVPIFATKKTVQASFLCSNEDLINTIRNNETIDINDVEVEAFSKFHRAADPVSYNISNGKKISIITDVGCVCNNVIKHVSDSDFLCIESNYDEEMLENGPYPYFLKKWIKSDIGHLSNAQSASCILTHAKPSIKHVMLSHLSKNNNSPDLALKSFSILKQRKDFSLKISVSQRESPTALFKI